VTKDISKNVLHHGIMSNLVCRSKKRKQIKNMALRGKNQHVREVEIWGWRKPFTKYY